MNTSRANGELLRHIHRMRLRRILMVIFPTVKAEKRRKAFILLSASVQRVLCAPLLDIDPVTYT